LDGLGIGAVEVVVEDDAVVLRVGGEASDPNGDAVSRAATATRGAFSPLLPCRIEVDAALRPGPTRWVDARRRPRAVIALAEVVEESPDALRFALTDLVARLPECVAVGAPRRETFAPSAPEAGLQALLRAIADGWADALAGYGGGSLTWLEAGAGPLSVHGGPGVQTVAHLVAWKRPAPVDGVGLRPALVLAASTSSPALGWLIAALQEPPAALPAVEVLLDGLQWTAARRPIVAVPDTRGTPIVVDTERCTSCGLCAAVCPTGFLDGRGLPKAQGGGACIGCMDCVEACPEDALRPAYGPESATRGELPAFSDGWLARLRGAPGPAEPAPFPPSYLLPKASMPDGTPPRVVLGIAMISQQEHAAALMIDGRVVGALEEEKAVRVRHYGWRTRKGVPWRNLGLDPTLPIEAVFPRRAIRHLLAEHGLTLDDVDAIALNGLPSRYRRLLPVLDADAPVPIFQAGRVIAVPHHVAHAASAFRVSGLPAAWVLTVDGRGDRETAALFRADAEGIHPVRTLLSLTDRSIGGVYETFTRLLGFGSHGQGSLMALAAMHAPAYDVSRFLSAQGWDDVSIHEVGIAEAFAGLARADDAPITEAHGALAASVQGALEQTLVALVRDGVGDAPVDALCLAGGVALNCKANSVLRAAFGAPPVWAQPGANDGGTALGAALEAWAWRGGGPVPTMRTASLGPSFDDDTIHAALEAAGVVYTRVDDMAGFVAERLAEGEVIAWFQDGLEFGPRALGARSLLADPRRAALHGRVNAMKSREPWRPFAPSILAGHEAAWFEDGFDSPFMLFTASVRPAMRDRVPMIVHTDGSTRPQVVHADTHPRYHAMISAFRGLTGVPMVSDTSFNRKGEPIVARPEDALEAFAGLGADGLAIGSFYVRRGEQRPPRTAIPTDDALAALPGGRRLMLRVATRCDLACGHCTMRDHRRWGTDPAASDIVRSLVAGREAGCDALVLMRGEPTLRPERLRIVERARRMGYREVQVQTHGGTFADRSLVAALVAAGLTAAEVQLLGADAATHDAAAGKAGSFQDTLRGLQNALAEGLAVFVTVPVLRVNALTLPRVVALLHKIGVGRVQFTFPRPVERPDGVPTDALLRLSTAAWAANRGARAAQKLGLQVSTEGFPLCVLDAWLHGTPDATEDFGRHRIDDMGQVHDDVGRVRGAMRPDAPPCRGCARVASCPKTWGLYTEMFGTSELRPIA
jgi:carbamoyltransferase